MVVAEKSRLQFIGGSFRRVVELVRISLRFRSSTGKLKELRIKCVVNPDGSLREKNLPLAMVLCPSDGGMARSSAKLLSKQIWFITRAAKALFLPLITRHIHMRRPQQTPPRYRVSQRFIKHIALPSMSRQPPRPEGKSDQRGTVEHQGWNGTGNPLLLCWVKLRP